MYPKATVIITPDCLSDARTMEIPANVWIFDCGLCRSQRGQWPVTGFQGGSRG